MWGDISLRFLFAFSWWLVMLSIIFEYVGHLYVFFGKMSLQILCLFKILSSLCILDIKLLAISFANIFSPSTGCLFILLIVLFTVQKCFNLVRYICLIFLLMVLVWGTDKKLLLRSVSKKALPMFSYRCFMVIGCTVKSLIHFEFIFVYGMRKKLSCFLLFSM